MCHYFFWPKSEHEWVYVQINVYFKRDNTYYHHVNMGDLNKQANFHLQFVASWWQKKNIRWQKHKKWKWLIKPHNDKRTRYYYYYYLLTITGTHCFLFVRYAIVQLIIRCEKLNCDNVLIITFFQFSFSMKIKTFCSFCRVIFSKYFWATEAGCQHLLAVIQKIALDYTCMSFIRLSLHLKQNVR